MLERIKREPVLIVEAVRAILLLGPVFGFALTGAQGAAIIGAVSAVLAVVTRQMVTPAKPEPPKDDDDSDGVIVTALGVAPVGM